MRNVNWAYVLNQKCKATLDAKLSFEDYQIMPVQRIPRYVLLVEVRNNHMACLGLNDLTSLFSSTKTGPAQVYPRKPSRSCAVDGCIGSSKVRARNKKILVVDRVVFCRDVAKKINEQRRLNEAMQKVMEIQQSIIGFSEAPPLTTNP